LTIGGAVKTVSEGEPLMSHTHERIRRAFTIAEGTAILSRTPAILDAWLRGLPAGWLGAHEGGNTWSPYDVVGHLIHGEYTDWIPRAKIILEHGEARTFEPFNRLAQFETAPDRPLDGLLDEFADIRRTNLQELDSLDLTVADLERRGRHPELGVVTLGQLLATWVAHDLDHLIQISRIMGRQYTDAVGPWRQYLRIIE
jgi:DinB family protein